MLFHLTALNPATHLHIVCYFRQCRETQRETTHIRASIEALADKRAYLRSIPTNMAPPLIQGRSLAAELSS